jgi:transposase InsO family protein
MKASKFSDAQKAFILKQGSDGAYRLGRSARRTESARRLLQLEEEWYGLQAHWFLTLADAREKLEDWLKYYNEDRPHEAISNKTRFA